MRGVGAGCGAELYPPSPHTDSRTRPLQTETEGSKRAATGPSEIALGNQCGSSITGPTPVLAPTALSMVSSRITAEIARLTLGNYADPFDHYARDPRAVAMSEKGTERCRPRAENMRAGGELIHRAPGSNGRLAWSGPSPKTHVLMTVTHKPISPGNASTHSVNAFDQVPPLPTASVTARAASSPSEGRPRSRSTRYRRHRSSPSRRW